MKLYLLIFITVTCEGIEWEKIINFKNIFQQYNESVGNAIASINDNFINKISDGKQFIDEIYEIPIIKNISLQPRCTNDCLDSYIPKYNMHLAYGMQLFQLENPLMKRIIDIQENINKINSTIDYYQGLADSKYWSCQTFNESCFEETEIWLESQVDSLSCSIFPNCQNHLIEKRSIFDLEDYLCPLGQTIPRSALCDGKCDCSSCADEISECGENCSQFQCDDTQLCIPFNKKCDGINDCKDGSDEKVCHLTPHSMYPSRPPLPTNCSSSSGNFLCDKTKCITLDKVCDGYSDCVDGSDESILCQKQCSQDCMKHGGFCMRGPQGTKCFYECPPGMYETSTGCSHTPETAPSTLFQLLEDAPQLISRYSTRVRYLKTKTMNDIYKSILEIAKCKGNEYTSLSKVDELNIELVTPLPNLVSIKKFTSIKTEAYIATSNED